MPSMSYVKTQKTDRIFILLKDEETSDDESSKLFIRRGVKRAEWNETRGIGFAFDQPCNE